MNSLSDNSDFGDWQSAQADGCDVLSEALLLRWFNRSRRVSLQEEEQVEEHVLVCPKCQDKIDFVVRFRGLPGI